MKKILSLVLCSALLTLLLAGCGNYDDTVQTCIIAGEAYTDQTDLEAAEQPGSLSAGSPAYASIHFIESPKGMAYTVKWTLNDTEIKTETKGTQNAQQDTLVYTLEADKLSAGHLKIEILYDGTVLLTQELPVK